MFESIKSRFRYNLENIVDQVPGIGHSISTIISEVAVVRYLVSDLEDAYENKIHLLELEIENLNEKIKTLEGGKYNE